MSFICKIARNLSLKRLEFMKRKKRSAEIILSLDELAAVLPDERYAPDVSDEDVGKLISKFLRSQEEYVRNVFIRKYFYFDSIREIAKRYSFTESKVKNMLFYTRNKLKDYLIKEGVEIWKHRESQMPSGKLMTILSPTQLSTRRKIRNIG